MIKTASFATLTLLAASLALAACSTNDRASTLAPGTYQNKTSSTDVNGTSTDKTTTTDVSVDANGNKHVSTTNKTAVDPKGLFNKKTSTTQDSQTYPND